MSTQPTKEQLTEALVAKSHMTAEALDDALRDADAKEVAYDVYLVSQGILSHEHLTQALAETFMMVPVVLSDVSIPPELYSRVPETVARSIEIVPYEETDDVLRVATCTLDNYERIKLLEKKIGKHIATAFTLPSDLAEVLERYGSDKRLTILEHINTLTKVQEPSNEQEVQAQEQSLKLLVDLLVDYAVGNNASDLHFEPRESEAVVRFRIDGMMHPVVTYPLSLHSHVVFRIKILAHLRTDEKEAMQDGKYAHAHGDTRTDVRVSIAPVTFGENVVLRLLTHGSVGDFTLCTIGLREEDHTAVQEAATKSDGMILAVGPTGSGKTTTLYSIIRHVKDETTNVMTIEDPVEYEIDDVQQIQINPVKDISFATGLRAIVRQDPDVIMVGEIRDEETATMAVNAAMTGHLVLSTLHANDAATTFPRLLEMGIEPYLLASCMRMVVAQRLVRKICPDCKASYHLEPHDQDLIAHDPLLRKTLEKVSGKTLEAVRLYKGVACDRCAHTGFSGRVAIFEVLTMTNTIRDLIVTHAPSQAITNTAEKEGMRTLVRHGVEQVLLGNTTIDELIRIMHS